MDCDPRCLFLSLQGPFVAVVIMIDGSEKRKLGFELQSSRVIERSNNQLFYPCDLGL